MNNDVNLIKFLIYLILKIYLCKRQLSSWIWKKKIVYIYINLHVKIIPVEGNTSTRTFFGLQCNMYNIPITMSWYPTNPTRREHVNTSCLFTVYRISLCIEFLKVQGSYRLDLKSFNWIEALQIHSDNACCVKR